MLVIGQKMEQSINSNRAIFAILKRRPESSLEGELIASELSKAIKSGGIRRLEDGPFHGSTIFLGSDEIAQVIDAPLPSDDSSWQIVGIADLSLAQTAFQLENGLIWIEGQVGRDSRQFRMCKLKEILKSVSHHHLDITGAKKKKDGLSQGPFEKLDGWSDGDAYPSLWNHDAKQERLLMVRPDSHLRIRDVNGVISLAQQARAADRFGRAAFLHYNIELRFNSQSLVSCFTSVKSVGGVSWPAISLGSQEKEKCLNLWLNSTLGILLHWWNSNKSQSGRGRLGVQSLPDIPVLDVEALPSGQKKEICSIHDSLLGMKLLPINQLDHDPIRAEIDRGLCRALGFDSSICENGGPLSLLRKKLSLEPQVHANKKSRVIFDEDGQEHVASLDEESMKSSFRN